MKKNMLVTKKEPVKRKPTFNIPEDKRHRFAKGQPSANPNGRPPTAKCIPDILRVIGDEPAPIKLIRIISSKIGEKLPEDICNRDLMLRNAHYDADLGDKDARDFVAERTEGKIKSTFEIQDPADADRARNTFRFEIIEKGKDVDTAKPSTSTLPGK